MRVVISQSMLFPWVGMLEQIKLADVFVHYDDVQFSKGSFTNRVQLKTPSGMRWMTIPLPKLHLGQKIDDVEVAPKSVWESSLVSLLRLSLGNAPFFGDAMALVENVFSREYKSIGALSRNSMLCLADYFGLATQTRFVDAADLGIAGSSDERVLSIVKHLRGTTYITGHGAKNYLDHQKFSDANVAVEYMNYSLSPYSQLHGPFTPYVSALDLVANCGKDGARYIVSKSTGWRQFLDEQARRV